MFENLIGNEKVKEILKSSINNNKITHSYLFIGPSGIGKTLFAKEFAKKILQQGKNTIDISNIPDLNIIEPEEKKIKIEQIRNLQSKISEKPVEADKKIYIIKEADTMTKEAQNCLLKTLEEPPEYAILILIATSESLILPTIKSRCMKILFNPIEEEKLKKHLENQGINVTNNLLEIAQGSIEKALKLCRDNETFSKVEEIFSNIENKTLLDVINKLDILYDKEKVIDILDYINIILYKKLKETTQISKQQKYFKYIQEVENTKGNIKLNCNFDMSIDNLLYKIWEE